MSESKWRKEAARIIALALVAGKVAGETGVALRKRVDTAYPFGQRQYLPYKMWLQARRAAFIQHELLTDRERERLKTMAPKANGKSRAAEFVADELEWEKAKECGLILPSVTM